MKGKFKFVSEEGEVSPIRESGHPELERLLEDLPITASLDAPGTPNISEENMVFNVYREANDAVNPDNAYTIGGVKTGNIIGIYKYSVDQESPYAGSFFNWINSSSVDVEVTFRGTTFILDLGEVPIQ